MIHIRELGMISFIRFYSLVVYFFFIATIMGKKGNKKNLKRIVGL